MSTEHTVDYIVTYTDPDRPVDGDRKTRHFNTEEQARDFVTRLSDIAPRAYQVQLEKWTRTVRKERLIDLDRVH